MDIPRQSETTTVSLIEYNEKESSDTSLLALTHSFQARFYPLVDWNPLTHEDYELAFEEKLERSTRHTNQQDVSAVGYRLKTTIVVNTIITEWFSIILVAPTFRELLRKEVIMLLAPNFRGLLQ